MRPGEPVSMAQKNIFQLDLLAIVKARTHATIAAASFWSLLIVLVIMSINSPATTSPIELVLNFLLLGVMIWQIVAVILLQVAMGIGVVTIVLAAIVNIMLPMIVPLAIISQSTTILKLAGAKTGFAGMSQSERDKITPGHCRGCGYSREGIGLLDPCPECTRVPQVI